MTPSISAVGASLLSVVLACSQAAPVAVPRDVQEHMKQERFDIVSSIRGLPLGVRGALQRLFESREIDVQRDIAQPGAPFLGTTGATDLPPRRMIAAECSMDHCLIYYERAGSTLTWHVALFHWDPDATRFEGGGLSPKRFATIAEARTALLSGTLKDSTKVW